MSSFQMLLYVITVINVNICDCLSKIALRFLNSINLYYSFYFNDCFVLPIVTEEGEAVNKKPTIVLFNTFHYCLNCLFGTYASTYQSSE
jgi:hypothetical protein